MDLLELYLFLHVHMNYKLYQKLYLFEFMYYVNQSESFLGIIVPLWLQQERPLARTRSFGNVVTFNKL